MKIKNALENLNMNLFVLITYVRHFFLFWLDYTKLFNLIDYFFPKWQTFANQIQL